MASRESRLRPVLAIASAYEQGKIKMMNPTKTMERIKYMTIRNKKAFFRGIGILILTATALLTGWVVISLYP